MPHAPRTGGCGLRKCREKGADPGDLRPGAETPPTAVACMPTAGNVGSGGPEGRSIIYLFINCYYDINLDMDTM